MHPDIKHLIELQAVDIRLAQLKQSLATFPKRLAEIEARVAAARADLLSTKQAHTNSLKERKTFEMDVDQWKERGRKYRDQSSAVKTNEAYKALQHEIANADAQMAQAEDRLLERMVAGEEYERKIKLAERALQEAEAAARVERQQIETAQLVAQKELAAATAERERAVAPVDEDLLFNYQRIANRHHGVGLAETRNEMCSQCGMRVRPHVFQELRRETSHEIFQCETCTRILYVADAPSSPATDPSEAGAGGGELSGVPVPER
jgi:predicted  nucleic acid-binding Zn-ribbon protein